MNLAQAKRKIANLETEIREKFHVEALYIFGSVARGTAHQRSDIDILVDFSTNQTTFFDIIALKDFLEKKLKAKVDLVTRDALKLSMKAEIERQAVRVA